MENSTLDSPLPDVSESRERRVAKILVAESVADVQEIVRMANKERTPLYPYSRGMNWGLGSRKPVRDDCLLVDLSRMTAIRQLDLDLGFAVVEAGTSQDAVAERLKGSKYMLNVTTSCKDSSLVGNALERGEGSTRTRLEDLRGLEMVLGTGELLSTGGIGPEGKRRYHALGSGPDLTLLFCQSNFGIATAGAFELMARPERIDYLIAHFDRSSLIEVADTVARLVRERVLDTTVRLSELPFEPGAGKPPAFCVFAPVQGRNDIVNAKEALLKTELSRLPKFKSIRIGSVEGLAPDDQTWMKAVFFTGTPSCALLQSRFGVTNCDLDANSKIGWAVVSCVIPTTGANIQAAIDIAEKAVADEGLLLRMEVSMITGRATNIMVQIWFKREPELIERMRRIRRGLRSSFAALGFHTVREPIDALDENIGTATGSIAGLKALFDPNGIISPGRYV